MVSRDSYLYYSSVLGTTGISSENMMWYDEAFDSLPKGMSPAKIFMSEYSKAVFNFRVIIFGKVCSVGDSSFDGIDLAVQIINAFELLGVKITRHSIQIPHSWSGLLGSSIEQMDMFY